MAKEYDFEIDGHPSIYKAKDRKLHIYFCEPDRGVNTETGLLLLIPGFGGHANSNIYKKMRSTFADEYNLVTIQCDYFGWEFMQYASEIVCSQRELEKVFSSAELSQCTIDGNLNLNRLFEIGHSHNDAMNCLAKMTEELSNFNDMGLMQAIDNITAVLVVMDILQDNNLEFNYAKTIIYGNSQGAYLSFLCNALAPFLFSLIIDNSAWLLPSYLSSNRLLYQGNGSLTLITAFEYLASKIPYDIEMLSLPLLYSKFRNKCNIITFHGTNDNLISHVDKRKFCYNIESCTYNEISIDKIDGEIIKSNNHGLDADYLKFFDKVMKSDHNYLNNKESLYPTITYRTKKFIYKIDFSSHVPVIKIDDVI